MPDATDVALPDDQPASPPPPVTSQGCGDTSPASSLPAVTQNVAPETPVTAASPPPTPAAPKDRDDTRSIGGSDTTITPELMALSSISTKPKASTASSSRLKKPTPASSALPDDPTSSTVSEVVVFGTGGLAKRRVICPQSVVSISSSVQGDFAFQRALGDGDFIASGHLSVEHQKSLKNTKDNTFIFYVVDGAVTVRIHQSFHTVRTGDMFMVPRGNAYAIENISDTPSHLIFTQGRGIAPTEPAEDPLRLVKRVKLPKGITTSKIFILLGWIVERLLKRFAIYRKLGAVWGKRARFMFHQHVHGSRAYMLFFVLGFLVRSVPTPWGGPPRVNIQFIKDSPSP